MPYSAAKACRRFPARSAPEDEGARRAARRGKCDSRTQPQGRHVRQVCVLDRLRALCRKSHAPAAAWRGRPSKERSPGNARPNRLLRGSPSIRRHSSVAGLWRGPRLPIRPRPNGPPAARGSRANLFIFEPLLGSLDHRLLCAALEPAAMPGPVKCTETGSKMQAGFGCAGVMPEAPPQAAWETVAVRRSSPTCPRQPTPDMLSTKPSKPSVARVAPARRLAAAAPPQPRDCCLDPPCGPRPHL